MVPWMRMLIAAGVAVGSAASARQEAMTPRALQAMASLPPDAIERYGSEMDQFGALRLPPGAGPHPVVVLIHGGCFRAAYATLRDLAPIGDALKREGIATWAIEYRRLGQPGGGWPGTYRDVAAAIDHLRVLAPRYRLDLRRVVFLGHSAGGHLALWGAARSRVPAGSPIAGRRPLRPRGTIDLAGPVDLRDNIDHYQRACDAPVVTQMMGGTPMAVPDRYRAASPAALLPTGVPQVLIWGERETFVPRPLAAAYVARAKAAGDEAVLHIVPEAGHFEIASPHPPGWQVLLAAVRRLLGKR